MSCYFFLDLFLWSFFFSKQILLTICIFFLIRIGLIGINSNIFKIDLIFLLKSIFQFNNLPLNNFLCLCIPDLVNIEICKIDSQLVVDFLCNILYLQPFGLFILCPLSPLIHPFFYIFIHFFSYLIMDHHALATFNYTLNILYLLTFRRLRGKLTPVLIGQLLHLPPLVLLLLSGQSHESDCIDKHRIFPALEFLVLMCQSVITLGIVLINLNCSLSRLHTFPRSPQFRITQTQIKESVLIVPMLLLNIAVVMVNCLPVVHLLKTFIPQIFLICHDLVILNYS